MSRELVVVVRVMERRSFTAAGSDVGLTGSAVAKLVSRVEDRLGVKLLLRSTRRLALTPEGEYYLQGARAILEDMQRFEEDLRAFGTEPSGTLRIGCGNVFGKHFLIPSLPAFLRQYPKVHVELEISDQRQDLLAAGLDLVVRHGTIKDSTLVVRRLCEARRLLCAAPEYLAHHPLPKEPQDLAEHQCLYSTAVPNLDQWRFQSPAGEVTLKVGSRMRLDTSEAVFHACRAGLGIAILSEMLASEAVARGELVEVMAGKHLSQPVRLSLVMATRSHRLPRMMAFVEFLTRRFSNPPWRVQRVRADGS